MKKLKYIDKDTFSETEHSFEEFHYSIAEKIQKYLDNTTVIISNKDGDKLILGVIKDRKEGEEISDKYKITIEKIKDDQG